MIERRIPASENYPGLYAIAIELDADGKPLREIVAFGATAEQVVRERVSRLPKG